jgi:hypothetical protein
LTCTNHIRAAVIGIGWEGSPDCPARELSDRCRFSSLQQLM